MLRSYITSGLRNLSKHKGYTAINIVGLSLGVASCILLLILVTFESTYDTFHKDVNRIHKVVRVTRTPSGETNHSFLTFGPLGPAMETMYPEVEHAVRIFQRWPYFTHGKKTLGGIICATDPHFFDVFDFEILKGDPETVFSEPFAVFVTESMARKFFGDEDPIGKVLKSTERYMPGDFVIRGVIRDLPRNTHLEFDVLTATIPENGHTDQLWYEWRAQSGFRSTNLCQAGEGNRRH